MTPRVIPAEMPTVTVPGCDAPNPTDNGTCGAGVRWIIQATVTDGGHEVRAEVCDFHMSDAMEVIADTVSTGDGAPVRLVVTAL